MKLGCARGGVRWSCKPNSLRSVLACISIALVAACQRRVGPEQEALAPARVGLVLPALDANESQRDRSAFEQMARAQGLAPVTLLLEGDAAHRRAQFHAALSSKLRVVVLGVEGAEAQGHLADAHASGVKAVAYGRAIPGADVGVAVDFFRVGALQAEQAIQATSGKGNYVLLSGAADDTVAAEVARGQRATLQRYVENHAIQLVARDDSGSTAQATKTVAAALASTKNRIQAVLAVNDALARAAWSAIGAARVGPGKIFLAGAGANPENLNSMCNGEQSVDVLTSSTLLPKKAAALAALLARGQSTDAEPDASGTPMVRIPPALVTPRTIQPLLIDSGLYAAAVLPSCVGREIAHR